MKPIDHKELQELQRSIPELVVIDVRLNSDFVLAHLPNAKSNCVLEIAFGERTTELNLPPDFPLCVYGAGSDSYESTMACEKLRRAGFTNVFHFKGGIHDWLEAGFKTESTPHPPEPTSEVANGKRALTPVECDIEWAGRNLGSKHWGNLEVSNGWITIKEGHPEEGELTIDMNSIRNRNLENAQMRAVLEDHLKSDDFFDVNLHPTATVSMQSFQPIPKANRGQPNVLVKAELQLRGQTHPIEFEGSHGFNSEGAWTLQANFDFDRTQWGVVYGSGRFFKKLGMHLVNDLISLQIKLVA